MSATIWLGELREPVLTGVKWGSSKAELKRTYDRGNELYESVPDVLQDFRMPIHGHLAAGGFFFGDQGLHMLVASLHLAPGGKRLSQKDILEKSRSVTAELKELYGDPWIAMPWDGKVFNHIWRSPETFIQFAWNGESGWGVHFRSIRFDPEMCAILPYLEELKKQVGRKGVL